VNDNTRAVSQDGEAAVEKNTRYVTLLVTTDQQGVVMLAQHQGQIKLSLRHPDDKDEDDQGDLKNLGKVLTGNAANTTNNPEAEDEAIKPLQQVSEAASSFFKTLNDVAEKAKETPPVAPASAATPPALPYETFPMVIIEGSAPRVVEMSRDKKNPKGTWVNDGVKGARLPRMTPSASVAPPVPAGTTTPEALGVTTQPIDSSVKNTTF
jgi:hypothetical protein